MRIERLNEALDALVPEILALTGAPGITIALGAGDGVAWAGGYGVADLATGRPMTADTVGPTGSDAKTYTALAAMQLVERGLIGLDDPVNDHLGGLRVVNPHGDRPITLRDLLTHRSGLGSSFGNSDRVPPAPLGEHLRRVFARGRSDAYYGDVVPFWGTQVGVNYQYSNVGIALVGYLVELLNPDRAGFGEWVRRRVFAPLAMTSSCFPPAQHPDHAPAELLARRSVGYATLPGLTFRLPPMYVGDHPAGSALTTPSDHARFMLAVAGGGALGGARVLGGDAARLMITPQAGRGPDPSATIGLVYSVFDHDEEFGYFGHGGEYPWGWHQVSRCFPRQRVAVVANANQWDLGDLGSSERPNALAGKLVLDIVTAWVRGEDPRPRCAPAAARGYLAGLLAGDRLMSRPGITTPPSDVDIDGILSSMVVAPGTPFDPAAFRGALTDLAGTTGSLPEAARLIRRRLPRHHLELVKRQVGVPSLGVNAPDLPAD